MADPFEAALAESESAVPYVEAFGSRYELARKIPSMPMLKFSKLASKGMKTDDMEAGAAMYDLLRSVFTKDAWARFENDATETGADSEELFAVVSKAIEVITGFPTGRPSASPSTPSTITPNSTVTSFEDRKRELGMEPVTLSSVAALAG